jgi:hypothetical protein
MSIPGALQAKYEEISKKVIMEILNVPSIIIKHNQGGGDAEFTEVIDASDVGNLKTLFGAKTAFGTRLTVAVKSKRNVIIDKINSALENKKEEIRKLYIEALADLNLNGDVPEDFEITVDKGFSQGSKTIRLLIKRYTLDKKTNEAKYASNPDYAFTIFSKGLKNDTSDPHELMTGSLIAMEKIVDVSRINNKKPSDRNEAIENLLMEVYDKAPAVDGIVAKEREAIKGDIVNLSKALSVSNYVVSIIKNNGGSVERVYQTGKSWVRDIAHLKGKDKTMDSIIKAYNSSDLIVKFSLGKQTHFWGLSLKKKGIGIREPDPTLLNKPVVGESKTTSGYLVMKAPSKKGELENAELNFFAEVYKVKFGNRPYETVAQLKSNRKTWLKKLDEALTDNEKNAALTGKEHGGKKYPKNTWFEKIDEVFKEVFADKENFKEFLDLTFRINIDSYVDQEHFHFSLITGAGGIDKQGKLVVNKCNEKNSVFLKEVFTTMFQGGPMEVLKNRGKTGEPKFEVRTTAGKKQAFETNAGAAKLFYTLWIDKMPICDLEVRYKGAMTSSPQFQVFITRRFQGFLAAAKRKLQDKGIHAILQRAASV